MCEDLGLCTYVRHHQQKIVLFLSAMRSYAEELEDAGYDVHYVKLDTRDDAGYEDRLAAALKKHRTKQLLHFEVEDRAMERRLIDFADDNDLKREQLRSPMFQCSRERFADFAGDKDRLLMADFYKLERERLGVLVDADGKPEGGRWSFDEDNRRKLPAKISPPAMDREPHDEHTEAVIDIVADKFNDHPGDARQFWWPTTRRAALKWLRRFLAERFEDFGPYEDAITTRSATVFHSVLSPLMNLGLITPAEIVERATKHARDNDVPLQSVEGFVRQIIGWREFIRGIYRVHGERQERENFFSHER